MLSRFDRDLLVWMTHSIEVQIPKDNFPIKFQKTFWGHFREAVAVTSKMKTAGRKRAKKKKSRRRKVGPQAGWTRGTGQNKVFALDALAVSGWMVGAPEKQRGWSSEHGRKTRLPALDRATAARRAQLAAAMGASRPGQAALGALVAHDARRAGAGTEFRTIEQGGDTSMPPAGGAGGAAMEAAAGGGGGGGQLQRRCSSPHLADLVARQRKVLHIYYDDRAGELRWGAANENKKRTVAATRDLFLYLMRVVLGCSAVLCVTGIAVMALAGGSADKAGAAGGAAALAAAAGDGGEFYENSDERLTFRVGAAFSTLSVMLCLASALGVYGGERVLDDLRRELERPDDCDADDDKDKTLIIDADDDARETVGQQFMQACGNSTLPSPPSHFCQPFLPVWPAIAFL